MTIDDIFFYHNWGEGDLGELAGMVHCVTIQDNELQRNDGDDEDGVVVDDDEDNEDGGVVDDDDDDEDGG